MNKDFNDKKYEKKPILYENNLKNICENYKDKSVFMFRISKINDDRSMNILSEVPFGVANLPASGGEKLDFNQDDLIDV